MAASLDRLEASHDVKVAWRAFELRPVGSPPISSEYRQRIAEMRPRFIAQAKALYDIDIQAGPFGINSRPALIGAKFAAAGGVGDAYHDAVFRAYWEAGQDISDTAVLAAIAGQVGLEPPTFTAALGEPAYEAAVDADIEQAFQYGLHAVPALVFANKYLVNGAQPYEVLAQVADRVANEQATAPGD